MIGAVTDWIDRKLGRGRHSIAVPVMDGPLHPNTKLEEAARLAAIPDADNLIATGRGLLCSAGPALLRLGADAPEEIARFDAPISALAAQGKAQGETLAVALDGEGPEGSAILIRGGPHDGLRIGTLGGVPAACITALAFDGPESLLVCTGAEGRRAADWKRDLMAHGRSGALWRVTLGGGAERLAAGLAWPAGVAVGPEGPVVSEAWRHRLCCFAHGAPAKTLLDELPGYPSRLVPSAKGGWLLAVFAPRNQLVEFVLREPEFLAAMTREVHPDHWIAPKLMWGQGFKEPMQGAALKTMGIIKPWAPTWSYGLALRLDDAFRPVASFHSRADGKRHGVTAVAEWDGRAAACARGAGEVIAFEIAATGGGRA